MPSRYVQSIYKQYTIFLKDQEAQKARAAEDMIEELEDGGGLGVSQNNAASPRNRRIASTTPIENIREAQLAQIKANLSKANETAKENAKKESEADQIARRNKLAELQQNVLMGRQDI